MKRPFIIDCDTGTDDAIMLAAAVYADEMDIKAVTSCNGNVAENYVTRNNIDLLEYFGVNIPVASGAKRSIYDREIYEGPTHGKSGLGDVRITETNGRPVGEIASELIYEEALKANGELEILVTGPFTNIAIAVINHPDLANLIKHLWFMGGAVSGGNMNNNAEFNIWVDPIAAHIVLTSGIKAITMIGLDVTLKAIMTREDQKELEKAGTKASTFTAEMLDFMIKRGEAGGEGAVMHDALALAAALYPECMKYTDYIMDVEWRGDYTAGHTVVDLHGKSGKKTNVKVATEIDVPSFRRWLVDAIKRSSER